MGTDYLFKIVDGQWTPKRVLSESRSRTPDKRGVMAERGDWMEEERERGVGF